MTVTTLYATEDVWIASSGSVDRFGAGLDIGDPYGILVISRSLVDFDMTSIPVGSVASSASLVFRIVGWSAANPPTVLAQRVTSAWDEGTVLWSSQPSSTAVNQGSSSSFGGVDATFDVTAAVNDILAGVNHGFLLRLADETPGTGQALQLAARESASPDPTLTINWSPPASKPRMIVG